jgi:hypothetical protein
MRPLAVIAIVLALLAAGCGRGRAPEDQPLRLEELRDTTGLTAGRPLIRTFEPYRMSNGVLRVRGQVDFPDGTRLQVSIHERAGGRLVQRFQVVVRNRKFDSPPLIGHGGPLPVADYRFEVLTHFNDAWQPPEVLRETDDGHALRGPGITRGNQGEAVFRLVEESRI